MLVVNYIRENFELIKKKLKKRHFKNFEIIDAIIRIDNIRKTNQSNLDNILKELKILSKKIAVLIQKNEKDEIEFLKSRIHILKKNSKDLQNNLYHEKNKLYKLLCQVPNLPHESVPYGKTSKDNQIIFEKKFKIVLSSDALPHWELVKKYQLIDFELGIKVAGAGFPVFIGKGARLQHALIQFFLENNSKKGYKEIIPPFLINTMSGFGTGQLPDKEEEMYHIKKDNLYLIPTAEVPVTNLYRNILFSEHDLPILNTAYSPCFRREAGSYGKNVRGLNRLHQFEKVEIVRIEKPENSYQAIEEMVILVKELIEKLELPYRILRLCTGDMNFSSALTYDFEVWSAGQQKWLEVSSVSNFENFQSNRLKLRYKSNGKTNFCHTLNGSALALPRIYAALIENNQFSKGIKIPKVLQYYTNFEYIN